MLRTTVSGILTFVLTGLIFNSPASAENEGLPDLDEAVVVKLFASSERDLNRAISLCEGALKKGLTKGHDKFAKQLAAATLYQLASAYTEELLEQKKVDPRKSLFLRRQALPKLEKAVEFDKEFGDAYYLIARLQALPNGDRKKALDAVGKAVRLAKNNQSELSRALVLRGDLSDDDDKKLADYSQAIIIDPNNMEALKARAQLYLTKNEFAKATADFKKLLELDGRNVEAHQLLIEALTFEQKFDEALEKLGKAIELDPKAATNYTLRARIHAVKGNLKAAMDDLNQALKLDDKNVTGYLMRAQLHQSGGNSEQAKMDVERALRIRPGLVQGILLRSSIAAANGDYTAAASDIQMLLRAEPNNVGWRLQLAAYYAADKRPRKAIEVFTQVLQDDAQNVFALRGRADALLSVGKHADAISDYEEAIKIDPKHTGVLNNLAWVLATSPEKKIRDGKRSIELGLKACEVTEYKQAHILSTLAAGYAESGDFEKAIEWSTKAVAMGKGDVKEQLEQELQSYKQKKPWREMQQIKEKAAPTRGGGDFEL